MSSFKNKKQLSQHYISQRKEVREKYKNAPQRRHAEIERIKRNEQRALNRYDGPTRRTIKAIREELKEASPREAARLEIEAQQIRFEREVNSTVQNQPPNDETEIFREMPFFTALAWSSEDTDTLSDMWGIQEDLTGNPTVGRIKYLGKTQTFYNQYEFERELRSIFRSIAKLSGPGSSTPDVVANASAQEYDDFTMLDVEFL